MEWEIGVGGRVKRERGFGCSGRGGKREERGKGFRGEKLRWSVWRHGRLGKGRERPEEWGRDEWDWLREREVGTWK